MDNKIKVLGVVFTNDENEAHEENYESKLRNIQSVTTAWNKRYLTIRGNITLVKSLLLPKLTHNLVSLPKPSSEFIKRLNSSIYNFVWGSKVDRLRRVSICKPYTQGGLSMIDINSHIDALKATWVRREIRSNHSWTSLFQHTIANGNVIWEWNRVSLAELSKKITNPFWVEVLEAVSKISDNIDMDSGFLNRSGLWYSNVTRYKTSCIVA